MKTKINTRVYTVEELLENYSYAKVLEKIEQYCFIDNKLETDKALLMYHFEDNDVEAQQLIDSIILQQYYIGVNLSVFEETAMIMEKKCFMSINYSIMIGLN